MKKFLLGIAATIALAVLLFLVWHYRAETTVQMQRVSEALAARGPLGAAAFALGGTLWIALFLPASWVFLAAGAVWGLLWGLPIALFANGMAGVLSFALAKILFAGETNRPSKTKSSGFAGKLDLVGRVVREEGFRGAVLIRFSALPVWAVSYGLGAADLPWKHFLPASLAIVPVTWMYVAGGHAAGLATREPSSTNPGEWVLLGSSIAATLLVMVLLGRRAKGLLARSD